MLWPALLLLQQPLNIEAGDAYLERLSRAGYFRGQVCLVQGGRTLLSKGYGLENDKRIKPSDVFPIQSVSKTFTAAAIVKLRDQKRLRLFDPISMHLRGVPSDKRSITVEQLLRHTSGIANDYEIPQNIFPSVSKHMVQKHILSLPLTSKPGSRFQYSNLGYVLLAMIVESASGRSFEHFLRQEIFNPAGLQETWFQSAIPAQRAQISGRYEDLRVGAAGEFGNSWWRKGASNLASTAPDLCKWMLSEVAEDKSFAPDENGFGLGWHIVKNSAGAPSIYFHNGGQDGFTTVLRYYVGGKFAIALTQADYIQDAGLGDEIINNVLTLLRDRKPDFGLTSADLTRPVKIQPGLFSSGGGNLLLVEKTGKDAVIRPTFGNLNQVLRREATPVESRSSDAYLQHWRKWASSQISPPDFVAENKLKSVCRLLPSEMGWAAIQLQKRFGALREVKVTGRQRLWWSDKRQFDYTTLTFDGQDLGAIWLWEDDKLVEVWLTKGRLKPRPLSIYADAEGQLKVFDFFAGTELNLVPTSEGLEINGTALTKVTP